MSGVKATAAVSARLKAAVGDAAKVWDTLDSKTDPKAFRDRYVIANRIHSFEVTREASEPVEGESSQAIERRERVVIYGFYSYAAGTSEAIFQAEVDDIVAAFDPPRLRAFSDVPDTGIEWSSALMVEGPKLGRLGDTVVHYVRMSLSVSFDPIF